MRSLSIALLLVLICISWDRRLAFVVTRSTSLLPPSRFETSSSRSATKKDDTKEVDPVTRTSWYAVEALGKVFGSKSRKDKPPSTEQPPSSLSETLQRIQEDNEREYFLSGDLDVLIYDEDCTFSDPFVSFQGRDRFVANLQNLGAFISAYSAKPLAYKVDGNSVTTKFMVKLQLNLPWKPVLAWPWGVRCEIDPDTYLVSLHEESVSAHVRLLRLARVSTYSLTFRTVCTLVFLKLSVGH